MRSLAALLAALVTIASMSPTAAASEDGPLPCDRDPRAILLAIVDNLVIIIDYLIDRGIAAGQEAALKAKCSALEAAGVCGNDDALVEIPGTSTGHLHPHRARCYEYVLVPGADDPEHSSCPAQKKIQHIQTPISHTHSCVPINKFD